MLLSVLVSLGLLCYFKYGHFLIENFAHLAALIGFQYSPPPSSIVLPVGISFYTFATMSYTLDIYLRRATPARSFPGLRSLCYFLSPPRRWTHHASHRTGAAI
jgi:alginate O-acetyltransferase complex protein AlgI